MCMSINLTVYKSTFPALRPKQSPLPDVRSKIKVVWVRVFL